MTVTTDVHEVTGSDIQKKSLRHHVETTPTESPGPPRTCLVSPKRHLYPTPMTVRGPFGQESGTPVPVTRQRDVPQPPTTVVNRNPPDQQTGAPQVRRKSPRRPPPPFQRPPPPNESRGPLVYVVEKTRTPVRGRRDLVGDGPHIPQETRTHDPSTDVMTHKHLRRPQYRDLERSRTILLSPKWCPCPSTSPMTPSPVPRDTITKGRVLPRYGIGSRVPYTFWTVLK